MSRVAARNHWASYSDPVATWVVELPPNEPEAALSGWLATALAELEAFPVFRVEAAPAITYRRDRDGALAAFLLDHAARIGVVDLFSFTRHVPTEDDEGRFRAVGKVAWFDDGSKPVCGCVDDLGGLLARLRPHDVDRDWGLMSPLPPLWVTGPRLSAYEPRPRTVRVRVEIHSDIWLPWVHGYLDDKSDPAAWFDNRALAELHTPALNRALEAIGSAARSLDGDLFLEEEFTNATIADLVSDSGIRLSASSPGPIEPE